MAIPASQIVNVIPRVRVPGSQELEISGLILTDNPLAPFPQILSFPTKESVGDYFGTDSDLYNLAVKYFLGYDDSFKKPSKLLFARRVSSNLSAFLIGGAVSATIQNFKNITAGSFKTTINGVEQQFTNINFSTVTTYSDIALIIQASLRTVAAQATVQYSTINKGFIVDIGDAGADSSITTFEPIADEDNLVTLSVRDDIRLNVSVNSANQDIAILLRLDEQSGTVVSSGSEALTESQNMDSVVNYSQNWASFTTSYEASEDEVLALALWTTGTNQEYAYFPWVTSANLANQTASNTLADRLNDNNVSGVAPCYNSAELAVFGLSIGACIDWNRDQGAINYSFKSQAGIAPTVTDAVTATTLGNRRINFYGRYATRSDEFVHFYPGRIFGSYGFIDSYINAIWFRNVLQTAIYDGLKQAGRVPYTDRGYTRVKAWMTDPCERALTNGVIDAGVSLTEAQKAELQYESGDADIAKVLTRTGYFIQVLDPGAQVRVNRDSPICNVWYTYGGSINKIEVAATAIL